MSLSLSSGPVKLDTTGDGRYDQVCALSQAAINQGFIKLFEKQELAARTVYWSNKSVFGGSLNATLLPPQIELDVESKDPSEFTILLRFDKGRVNSNGGKFQVIDGWVLAFSLLSFEDCLDPTNSTAPSATDNLEEDVIFPSEKPTKIVPGEYSIHRLFAAVAGLTLGTIIWERSYMTQTNNQKQYLDKWAKDSDNNKNYNEVQQCLREWTKEKKMASCFAQGMLLKIPKSNAGSRQASLPPRALRLHNYPYIDEATQMALSSKKEAMKGTNGSPYNCLCFCEVVKLRTSLPSTKYLLFSGNLAGPAQGTGKEYLGTFVIDSRLFLGNTLLSQLQELCFLMQTVPLDPEVKLGGTYLPSGRRKRIIGNTRDLMGGRPYRWEERELVAPAGRPVVSVANRKTKTTSTSKITIQAGPQMTAYKVVGEYGYSRRTEFSSIDITDIASWSFTLSINNDQNQNEDLSIINNPRAIFEGCKTEKDPYTGQDILIPDDFTTNLKGTPKDPTWLLLRTAMRVNIGRALAKMKRDFTPFPNMTQFKYPGSGELKFGPSMFNEDLNLFATINYSPKDGRVSWPKAGSNENTSNVPTVYVSDATVTKDVPHLTWTAQVKTYKPDEQKLSLTLTGLNNANEPRAFKSVAAICLKMKSLDGKSLFPTENQYWARKVTNPTASDTWSIVNSKFDAVLELNTERLSSGQQFKTYPTILDTARDGSYLPSKFIIPPTGSVAVELIGILSSKAYAGIYIIQINETWAGVRPNKPLQGGASTFLRLELKVASQQVDVTTISQAAADAIRGVAQV